VEHTDVAATVVVGRQTGALWVNVVSVLRGATTATGTLNDAWPTVCFELSHSGIEADICGDAGDGVRARDDLFGGDTDVRNAGADDFIANESRAEVTAEGTLRREGDSEGILDCGADDNLDWAVTSRPCAERARALVEPLARTTAAPSAATRPERVGEVLALAAALDLADGELRREALRLSELQRARAGAREAAAAATATATGLADASSFLVSA